LQVHQIELEMQNEELQRARAAAKHAQAHRVWVRMSRTEQQQVRMEVCDDGVGFDPAQPAGKSDRGGFGMFSIRTRLEVLDGQMEVFSSPGRGTQAMIRVPLGKAKLPTADTGRELKVQP
jgi:nitrate/nitrite-specific signal transduction histidine kinase